MSKQDDKWYDDAIESLMKAKKEKSGFLLIVNEGGDAKVSGHQLRNDWLGVSIAHFVNGNTFIAEAYDMAQALFRKKKLN